MLVHDLLEAWPEEYVGVVNVVVHDGEFAVLELEGEVLIQTHADEDAETVGCVLDELLREVVTEVEGGLENVEGLARDLLVGGCSENLGGDRVLRTGVVDEGLVEVAGTGLRG